MPKFFCFLMKRMNANFLPLFCNVRALFKINFLSNQGAASISITGITLAIPNSLNCKQTKDAERLRFFPFATRCSYSLTHLIILQLFGGTFAENFNINSVLNNFSVSNEYVPGWKRNVLLCFSRCHS